MSPCRGSTDACADDVRNVYQGSGSENIGVSASWKSWHGWRHSAEAIMPLDMRTTLEADAEQAGRAIEVPEKGGTMARRGFQQGMLFQRGARRKVWVARWWVDVIQVGGTLGRIRRSEVIGTVADLPTRRKAMQVLSQKLRAVN